MPLASSDFWTEHLRVNLRLYSEPLLRQTAAAMLKPRNQWPVEDLIERMTAAVGNAPVVDRILKKLPAGCRRLLAAIALSSQPCWNVGSLVEILVALGEGDGLGCVQTLLQSGLLYPELSPAATCPNGDISVRARTPSRLRCQTFATWLSRSSSSCLRVCAHPEVSQRLLSEDLGLPDFSLPDSGKTESKGTLQNSAGRSAQRETDGLEWFLRLALLWQEAARSPFRLTQQGDFFKRDLERLRNKDLLGAAPADSLERIPEIGLLTAALALQLGAVTQNDGEVQAGKLPQFWNDDLSTALQSIWRALLQVERWNHGQEVANDLAANPYPSAYLLCLLNLAAAPKDGWCSVEAIENWLMTHHPWWIAKKKPVKDSVCACFLLGVAYQLRFVAAKEIAGKWHVRLSAHGRQIMAGEKLPPQPAFPQALLVQPNLEILLFRQGAAPRLIADLARFARWTGLGPACHLQLQPETVYAALEQGETYESILQTLQQHGMKTVPDPVIASLRTWAQKRERITVYPSATVLEFQSSDDLEEAVQRGLPIERIGPQLAVVVKEGDLPLQHFKLRGSRDYVMPPEPCVEVEDDGVTLTVDFGKADLLLESELRRFADELDISTAGQHRFQLTLDSLRQGRENGLTLDKLENWFYQRCGHEASAAARLLLTGHLIDAVAVRRLAVLQVPHAGIADGLLQLPHTRALIAERLGPTNIAVDEENLQRLKQMLRKLGMTVD